MVLNKLEEKLFDAEYEYKFWKKEYNYAVIDINRFDNTKDNPGNSLPIDFKEMYSITQRRLIFTRNKYENISEKYLTVLDKANNIKIKKNE
ncbi:hypothetical protein KY313_01845 [Candidatus Woesearchaeota archaeon]|jgi:hypothetical protein|nr:hypothetical protein [Candidatus Woesearchaeota archaeon]